MVALVRGVHGLNGAVRAEVLTDRPEDRFVPGAVLYREGDDRPLTIASAEAIADGPGWRIRFREITTRDAADTLRGAYLEAIVRPRRGPRPRDVLLARGRRDDGSRRGRDELGTVRDIYRVGETEVYVVDGGPFGSSTCRRSAPSSGSSRRGAARSSSMPTSLDLRAPRSHEPDPDRPKAPAAEARKAPAADASAPSRPVTPAPRRGRADAPAETVRAMTLEIDVLTLFPAMIAAPLAESIPGRIQEQGLAVIRVHDLRSGGSAGIARVDDAPYGGGAGMILRPEPVAAALDAVRRTIRPSSFSTLSARSSARPGPSTSPLGPISSSSVPRYEGVDERIRSLVDLELSIGDYVLTGGELPALVVIDAVIRLLPGRDRGGVGRRRVLFRRAARVPAIHAAGRLSAGWTCRLS